MNSNTKPASQDKLKAEITITKAPEIAVAGSTMSALVVYISIPATIKVGKGVIFDGCITARSYDCIDDGEDSLVFSTSEGDWDWDMKSLLEIVCQGIGEEIRERVECAIYDAVDDVIDGLIAGCNQTLRRDFSNADAKKAHKEKHSISRTEKKGAGRRVQA
jgi:hypothetical protein